MLSENMSFNSCVEVSIWNTCIYNTKEKGTARFITDYLKLDKKLVRKMYILPRIGETMQLT